MILPDTDVAVIVGSQDSRFGFIDREARFFLNLIEARSESYRNPNAPHQVLRTQEGHDVWLAAILGMVTGCLAE